MSEKRTLVHTVFAWVLGCLIARGSQSVSLQWNAIPGAGVTGYVVRVGPTWGQYSSALDVGTNTIVTITGLVEGSTNWFVVTSHDGNGIESVPSNAAMFVAPATNGPPQLDILTPTTTSVNGLVTISGANLGSTLSVNIGGVSAPFTIASDSVLNVTVPAGTSGGVMSITTQTGTLLVPLSITPLPPPANDNFSSAQPVSGTMFQVSVNTAGATKEPGEPDHAGNPGGHSIWYQWTAPTSDDYSLDGSSSDFNTLLAVYTGNSVAGLTTFVASESGSMIFTAVAGTTYHIALDGINGASGNAVLQLAPVLGSIQICTNSFDASEGFVTSLPLAGQNGWLSIGSGRGGIMSNSFVGFGQQGDIGFSSAKPATNSLLYRALDRPVDPATRPLVQFSALVRIDDFLNLYSDVFGWSVRNAAGQTLFGFYFDNKTKHMGYQLDDGAGMVSIPFLFVNGNIAPITMAMDFARNQWSTSWNGQTVVSGLPITTRGAALTLGDIDAAEVFPNPAQPGLDGMVFDNYSITASPSTQPQFLSGLRNQSAPEGSDVMLGVIASGTPPLSYQWYSGFDPISGATNAALVLDGVTSAQNGIYTVLVFTGSGSTSSSATLNVVYPPPRALLNRIVKPGQMGVALNADLAMGYHYAFQASADLKNWTTLAFFYASGPGATCLDPQAANMPTRFYRLVTQ